MKSGLLVLAVIALAVVLVLGWAVSVNNSLVTRDQAVQESWAQVQNVYQQRADLVPEPGRDGEGVRRPGAHRPRRGHPRPRQCRRESS